MRTDHPMVLGRSKLVRLFLAGLAFVVASQLKIARAQTPTTPTAPAKSDTTSSTSTSSTSTSSTSTSSTSTSTGVPKAPDAPTTPDPSPYAIDPVTLNLQYRQLRNPNTVSYVKPEKPLSLKITYKGPGSAPDWIQVKITYRITGLEGNYKFDGVYALKDGAYALDGGLDAFVNELFAEESELLPKDFNPVRPLAVDIRTVTVIPSKNSIDPATGKASPVASGNPQGQPTSNNLKLTLQQVIGGQSAKPAAKAPAGDGAKNPPAAAVPPAEN